MENQNNKVPKEELKGLALDVFLFTNGQVNLAETLYYKGFFDYEDVKEIENIYEEIKNLETETEKQSKELEDNIHALKNYFPDILKDKQQTEELIASLEERKQNLENELKECLSLTSSYTFKTHSDENFKKEVYAKIDYLLNQTNAVEEIIDFLKYGKVKFGLDKEKYSKIKKVFDLDIFDVIEKELNVRVPHNGLVQIKCPLHNDKNPSFTIYRNTNSFYCFGCQAGGGVVTFIKKFYGFSNQRAIEYLIDHYAI